MVRLAAMIALQVVLSRWLSISIPPALKFSFGFTAVALAAYLYGVPGACLVAALSDVIGAVLFPMGEFFIGYTLTATLTGLIYGLFLYRGRGKGLNDARVVLCFSLNAIIVTMLINTLVIAYQYGYRLQQVKDLSNIPVRFVAYFPKRALEALVMLPVQCITSTLLLRPRKTSFFRYALLPIGALLAALSLNVDLSTLRQLEEGEAFVRYISNQLFPNPLVATVLFVLSLILLLRAVKKGIGLFANLAGLISALIYTICGYFYKNSTPIPEDTVRQLVLFAAFLGAFLLFRALISLLFEASARLEDKATALHRRKCALTIFICCIPWLLLTFPGTLTADAYDQLNQFMGTLYPGQVFSRSAAVSTFQSGGILINDAQSVLHTCVLGALYWLFWKTGNANIGICFFVLVQTLLFALTAARSMELLCRVGIKRRFVKLLTAFYALFPLYPMYFCTTLKESALAISLLGAFTFLAEILLFPPETLTNTGRLMGGGVLILLCLLLRSFSALILLPPLVCALLHMRRSKKDFVRLGSVCMGAYILWALVSFGLYPLLGVGKAPGVEKRSLMIQQAALAAIEEPSLDEKDKMLLEKVYGTLELKENYLPYDADPLKFYTPDRSDPTLYSNNALHYENWKDFDALWFRLTSDAYPRAYMAMEASYWDLSHDPASSGLQLYLGDYGKYENGIEGDNPRATQGVVEIRVSEISLKLQKLVRSLVLALSRLPVLSFLFRSGTYLYLCLIVFVYALKTHHRSWILPLTLLLYGFGLGFGPVSGNSRYAFPILVCAPFIALLCVALPQKSISFETAGR